MNEASPLFGRLPDEEQRAVRSAARRRRFHRGSAVFFEGDLGDALHVIDRGHVAIQVSTPRGDVATLTVLGPGDSFGEHALLDPESRRSASAVCLDDVETLAISQRDFEDLRSRLPVVERFLTEALASQVHRLSAMVLDSIHLDAETRIYRRVLALTDAYDDGRGDPVIAVSQDDIATMAGTTRPTVNRVLKAAEAQGAIALGRNRLTVLDRGALARLAR